VTLTVGKLQRLGQPINVLLTQHPVNVFIETGTFHGESLAYALTLPFSRWHSVELAPHLHRSAEQRFGRPQVTLHCGDSAEVLPKLLTYLDEPALFWLDAHYCFFDTARGAEDCPLMDEVRAIADHERQRGTEHIVIIDDYHIFGTTSDGPWLVSEEVVFVPEADWSAITYERIEEMFVDCTKNSRIWGDALFLIPPCIDVADVNPPPNPYERASKITSGKLSPHQRAPARRRDSVR